MNSRFKTLFLFLSVAAAQIASAGTTDFNVHVTATIVPSCVASAPATLNFGSIGAATDVGDAPQIELPVDVTCSAGTSYNVIHNHAESYYPMANESIGFSPLRLVVYNIDGITPVNWDTPIAGSGTGEVQQHIFKLGIDKDPAITDRRMLDMTPGDKTASVSLRVEW